MDILELAISLEHDLENFYRKQAELNEGNNLSVVFTLLAKEEEKHANILTNNADKLVLPFTEGDILAEVQSIFKNINDFKSDIKDIASQLDAYRMALGKEEESLKFYRELHEKASEEQSKTVFQYLIKQEDKHCIIMEELIKLLTRPEEWVESAEFGIREDY